MALKTVSIEATVHSDTDVGLQLVCDGYQSGHDVVTRTRDRILRVGHGEDRSEVLHQLLAGLLQHQMSNLFDRRARTYKHVLEVDALIFYRALVGKVARAERRVERGSVFSARCTLAAGLAK